MGREKGYNNRVVIESGIHFGKPCIAGTRIPVEDVLGLVEEGIPFKDIITRHYPDIEVEDIKACIHYAAEIVRSEEIHLEKAV